MALKDDLQNVTGEFKEFGGGVIDAIEGLANWIGLGRWWKNYLRRGNNYSSMSDKDKLLTEAELEIAINKIVGKAQAMGANKLTELTNKLAQLPTAISPTLKKYVGSAVADIQGKIKDQVANNAKVDVAATNALSKASEYATLSSGDIMTGKSLKTQNEALNAANQALNLAQNVEQKV